MSVGVVDAGAIAVTSSVIEAVGPVSARISRTGSTGITGFRGHLPKDAYADKPCISRGWIIHAGVKSHPLANNPGSNAYLHVMEIPVEMLLPPKVAARGNKGWGGFFQADEALTAYVVDRVTRAELDRLDECLDLILEDPSYHQMRQALMNQVPWELLLTTLDSSREPVTVPNVPTVVADRVVTGRRVEHILFRCIARYIVLRDTATDRIPLTPSAPRPEHPAMNFDAMIPHPVRRVLLYQKIGEICGRALMSERIVSSALADALVERWLRGLWGMLGYMVHLGLADAAKVGLPERYRLVDVQEQFDEERSGFVAALEEVERSGKGYPQVYLSDEDDDDNEDVED